MTTTPTDTQLQGEMLLPPRWTVCYNIVSPESDTWVGRGWEFFNDEKDADACYRRHQRSGNVPTKRRFYNPVDYEHLGVADQKRLSTHRAAAVAGPRGDALTDSEYEELMDEWLASATPAFRESVAKALGTSRAATSSPAPAEPRQVRCVHGVPEGLTCAICGPIRNDDPPTFTPARVEGEQDVKQRIESIAEPWICVEERPCEEAVPVHWDEMITALVAAEQRTAAASADNDAESLLQHVAYSGVEFDDNRIGYVVVQIDRDVWEQIKKLAPTTTKGGR